VEAAYNRGIPDITRRQDSSMLRLTSVVVTLSTLFFIAGCSGGSSHTTTPPPPTSAQLTIAPSATLSFGSVTVGQTSPAQVLTLTSSGTATLTLTAGSLAGASADFSLTSASTCGTSASLAPGASCTLSIAFAPQTTGTLTATITLTDNASNSPQTITLTGSGTAAPVPQATLTPTGLPFPVTIINSTSPAQTATLTNTGNATLSIASIALGGTNSGNFAETNTCAATLAAGSSCTISVTFTPAAAASYIATLIVTDNAGNTAGTTQSMQLTGSGTAAPVPVATITPTSLTFPTTTVGQTSVAQAVMLTNAGNATLTLSYAITGATADFTATSTCGASLAPQANCTFSIDFAPQTAGSLTAALTLTDNAANSPQTVTLAGNATSVPTPQATFTPVTGLIFPTTPANDTSAAQALTLTNTGNATLSITGIALGGTNPTDFAETNTCPATLAAGASCPISVTFSPTAAATYTATLTVTGNSGNTAGSTQSAPLKGMGSSSPVTVTHTLYAFPESDNTVTPLYTLINTAQSTIDMTMYELEDTTFLGDLIADCKRGVTVRVLLDASLEMTNNTPAYNQLNTSGANCSAVFSNTAFQATHQKTITIDGTTTAILTLNLQSQYYSTSRDFAFIENDPADIAAIEETFNEDYAAGTPYQGTPGTSDFSDTPNSGDDLIWSPTTAQQDMLSLITSATKTLLIENEELSAANIVSALETACKNGVTVHLVMSETSTTSPYSSYASNWVALEHAGCGVHVYPDTATGLYIHAKAVVADYGLSTQNAYVGSINYSIDSMTENRELGLYVSDPTAVGLLNTTMSADYAGGSAFTGGIVD
jgi:phosphatidylserine/phosphatidylglycerophosphate/cardiolipin synthase-like enzyme